MKSLALSALLVLTLTGCAKVSDTGMRLLATPAQALAVIDDAVLSGKVTVFIDRTATVNLESGPLGGLKCMGTLRYTATRSGVVSLQCSNGADVMMSFNAIGEASGYGSGKTAKGLASFAFGMDPADAAAYLKPPAGKRVVVTATGVTLSSP
jgi:hypothetical protein